jgi:Mn2+/Fe2+ NRAMP family transporter
MIPQRFEPVLFGLVLSGLMSFIVAGISTSVANGGVGGEFLGLWARSWLTAWAAAFPIVLLVSPLAQRMVRLITRRRDAAPSFAPHRRDS